MNYNYLRLVVNLIIPGLLMSMGLSCFVACFDVAESADLKWGFPIRKPNPISQFDFQECTTTTLWFDMVCRSGRAQKRNYSIERGRMIRIHELLDHTSQSDWESFILNWLKRWIWNITINSIFNCTNQQWNLSNFICWFNSIVIKRNF